MAELEQPVNVATDNLGAFYPQDYYIEKLNFILADGQTFDMKKVMVEFSYYEDIYSFVTSGYLTVQDAQGFIEAVQFTGNEFIEVDFGKIKGAKNNINKFFRVYKIDDRKPLSNMNSETYKIYFCSQELLESEQQKISKSYSGKTISEIINLILADKEILGVSSEKYNPANIEKTTGVYNFIVPNLKPFEAISWLSTYARPNTNAGADMLFFENKNGFQFRSLQTMYSQPVYASYKYQLKNLGDAEQPFQDKVYTVLNYEFVKTFNMAETIKSGGFANKLISLDPMARKKQTTVFDYEKYKTQGKTLNKFASFNELKNRIGDTQSRAYDSNFKLATGNSGQSDAPYIKQSVDAVAKNIAIETYVPNRTAQIALANYIILKAMVPGDPGISAGRTINFDLSTLKPTSTKKDADKFYSGKYLVSAVRHIIQPMAYQTVLELTRDSSESPYRPVKNDSPKLSKVLKK